MATYGRGDSRIQVTRPFRRRFVSDDVIVPFCRKPERFSKAHVTKIANQVAFVCDEFDVEHFCHVGASEDNRSAMIEALLTNRHPDGTILRP